MRATPPETPEPLEVRARPRSSARFLRGILIIVGAGVAMAAWGAIWIIWGDGPFQRALGVVVVVLGGSWLRGASRRWSRERRRLARLAESPATLRVDASGVMVENGRFPESSPATVAWQNLAAVVVSRIPDPRIEMVAPLYLQFVADHEDRIVAAEELQVQSKAQLTARLCRVSPRAALMVWVVPAAELDRVDEALTLVRRCAPHVRIVDCRDVTAD